MGGGRARGPEEDHVRRTDGQKPTYASKELERERERGEGAGSGPIDVIYVILGLFWGLLVATIGASSAALWYAAFFLCTHITALLLNGPRLTSLLATVGKSPGYAENSRATALFTSRTACAGRAATNAARPTSARPGIRPLAMLVRRNLEGRA